MLDQPIPELLRLAHSVCESQEFKAAVLDHGRHLPPDISTDRFAATIHPDDQMLIHSLQHHADVDVALSQYYAISLQQFDAAMQVHAAFFDPTDPTVQCLDFACGYGRLLRFLSLRFPPDQLTASEIQADALSFIERQFGIRTALSNLDPERFDPGQRYDFIWVASLFSHLPDSLFRRWLKQLASLLTPRGVIAFSVRGAELLPPSASLPDSGILYIPDSEITPLAADVYGTTYASEHYVRDVVTSTLGADRPLARIRKGLAQEQDIYVLPGSDGTDLSPLETFRHGPWGWLDRRSLDGDGNLLLQGWAASLDDGEVERVDIRLGEKAWHCVPGIERADVAQAFDDTRLARCGWSKRIPVSADGNPTLQVSAVSRRGEKALLYHGSARAQS